MKIWMKGEIVPPERARLSVLDHGLLYGDGVFEGIRLYGGKVFRLHDHLRRLESGAKALSLALPLSSDALADVVKETCAAYGQPEGYVRLLVTRGEGALGVDPSSCREPQVICIAADIALFDPEKQARGLDLVTSSLRKPGPDVLDPRVKSLNYLNSVLAKQEAKRRGGDEALVLNQRGLIAEASVANVFVVRRGELLTPPTSDGCLEGITRDSVRRIATGLGIPYREVSLGRHDLFEADEAFLTGTGAKLVPIATLDGAPIGRLEGASDGAPGARPTFDRLSEAFDALVHELGVPLR